MLVIDRMEAIYFGMLRLLDRSPPAPRRVQKRFHPHCYEHDSLDIFLNALGDIPVCSLNTRLKVRKDSNPESTEMSIMDIPVVSNREDARLTLNIWI